MSDYGVFSDDYYVNMNLHTEMGLPTGRESLMHYFEQVRRRYPLMHNFYCREKDEFVLEEEKESGAYRWVSVEPKRVNSGVVNPVSFDDACEQHRRVLELVPYELSISPLDCEAVSLMLGFDFNYKGNHNEILCEAIGIAPALEGVMQLPGSKVLSNEPAIQFSLDAECRMQCRIGFESRTTAYQVRTDEFPEDQLSVYLTVRRYDSLAVDETYIDVMNQLSKISGELVDDYLIEKVLRPLQQAISLR